MLPSSCLVADDCLFCGKSICVCEIEYDSWVEFFIDNYPYLHNLISEIFVENEGLAHALTDIIRENHAFLIWAENIAKYCSSELAKYFLYDALKKLHY